MNDASIKPLKKVTRPVLFPAKLSSTGITKIIGKNLTEMLMAKAIPDSQYLWRVSKMSAISNGVIAQISQLIKSADMTAGEKAKSSALCLSNFAS